MKNLGAAKNILGMRVERSNNVITLDQSNYIRNVLDRFSMQDSKPARTPLVTVTQLEKGVCDTSFPYQSLVGCLMYIRVCTRPDIIHAVSLLSRFNTCYGEVHIRAAKRVLQYLKGTVDTKLMFRKNTTAKLDLCGYVDAAHGNDPLDKTSYTGYVFKLGGNVISWESRKQDSLSLSSTEAEYKV